MPPGGFGSIFRCNSVADYLWDTAITVTLQFGWNFDLRAYNVVPEDSPIFYFCQVGDLPSVQNLLQTGQAGLLDVQVLDQARGANGYQTLIEVGPLIKRVINGSSTDCLKCAAQTQ